jgi:hypothetical protein
MLGKFLLASLLAASSLPAVADCNAYLYADDWNGDLRSVNDVNDYCSKRANWWGIKVDPKNYCFTRKESHKDSYGREYFVWPTSFFYKLYDLYGYDANGVLQQAHDYLGSRVYKGWPASVKLFFDSKCY